MIARTLFTESKKLRIFDFDDTLVKTKSFIYITHVDGTTSKLSPAEYAVYEPKKGDEFDYSDFKNVKDPIELKNITKILKNMVKKDRIVYILTARSVTTPVYKYLKQIGIPLKQVKVIALNDSDPKSKAAWIEHMIVTKGYDDVFFADDSIKNVNTVKKKLRSIGGIKWKVSHINEIKL